jgi:anti-anti-sigma factor
MPKHLITRDENAIYHFHGELTIHELEQLRAILQDLQATADQLSLSFASVSFMDTAALQLFIAFRISLPPQVTWRLVALSPELEKILAISGLRIPFVGDSCKTQRNRHPRENGDPEALEIPPRRD